MMRAVSRHFSVTDRQIDVLASDFYGLTDKKIRNVDGETDMAAVQPETVSLAGNSSNQNAEAARVLAEVEAQMAWDVVADLERIERLDENGLREAVTPIMKAKQAKRLADLNRKAQGEGLTKEEEKESDELAELYEKSILFRAAALAELKNRGVDVSEYVAS